MDNIRGFIETFVTTDYFIIFLIILFMILIALIMALLKMKNKYVREVPYSMEDDMDLLDSLKSTDSKEELPPIDRNIDMKLNQEYSDIDSYEDSEEENAVISTDELEEKTKERMDALGISDNQAMIDKYEEEQEKKAIISYEQLLKNASNITISYQEEKTPEGAPKINKIEVKEKEVSAPQSYIEEEKFLSILKEFWMSLPR